MTMNDNPNYKEAFDELQIIVSVIEGDSISVDELSTKVKKSSFIDKNLQEQTYSY